MGSTTQLISTLVQSGSWTQANNDLAVTVNTLTTSSATVTVSYCEPPQQGMGEDLIT